MSKPHISGSSNFAVERRWTIEDARKVIGALRRSGLPVGAFAAEHGIDPQRLFYWRSRLGTRPPLRFEEVTLPAETAPRPAPRVDADSGDNRFEIVLLSNRVVRVGASFDSAALRRLVEILEGTKSC